MQQFFNVGQLLVGSLQSHAAHNGSFKKQAQVVQLPPALCRAGIYFERGAHFAQQGFESQPANTGAHTGRNLNQAHTRQPGKGLTHRRAAHAKFVHQFSLRGQLLPHLINAALNIIEQAAEHFCMYARALNAAPSPGLCLGIRIFGIFGIHGETRFSLGSADIPHHYEDKRLYAVKRQ